ncbi:3'(2'),5'-bisphosphate nucleotidase CysQ [Candidatus Erwinia haradaeae]|uniref:3'(2'),5'-bisphosphate nucleotidase CysQ n=1 Tax=Candidatus Erwinia haradaeae TaxID=1922217 RepID=A0A451D8U3_9GAMM|nr:3'(2'),5'-bisphosphate nucleotidase CysQ [Candidatus Erwinia haradaeae]VFP82252.1 3'(2'),5'-bisphosphate nucleotidase CysQ [Candidatus Erwinia haradaeae]
MIDKICSLAYTAGCAIIQVYNGFIPLDIQKKSDNSLVTNADFSAHKIISEGLRILTPQIPILSEEESDLWINRQNWTQYWLVDPLDGTAEFLNHNDEFTVNIALIQSGIPVLGVIYAPALKKMYYAIKDKAWKKENGLNMQLRVKNRQPPIVVISRSHNNNKKLNNYLKTLPKHQVIKMGSSLKFCMVAEGKAQIYPRLGKTHIWDTGAGHAIAIGSGAKMTNFQGEHIDYTPTHSCLNPEFIVSLI